jgi:predicted nuclease with TOPRIM domain
LDAARDALSTKEDEVAERDEEIARLSGLIEAGRPDEELGRELDELREDMDQLQNLLTEKEGEVETLRASLEAMGETHAAGDRGQGTDALVSTLETRLEEAYRKIGQLKAELAASPNRKTTIEVRDARIRALEREKAALAERLATRSPAMASMRVADSPPTESPFIHRAIASIKMPKTPGTMREVSVDFGSILTASCLGCKPRLEMQTNPYSWLRSTIYKRS